MTETQIDLEKLYPSRRLNLLLKVTREANPKGTTLWERLPREAKRQAFVAYLQGQTAEEISNAFGIPLSTLEGWCVGLGSSEGVKLLSSWRHARDDYERELVRQVMASKRDRIDLIVDDSLTALHKIVKHLAAQETPHPNHIKPLLGVVTGLDKVVRLEDGKPTDIKGTQTVLTKEEILSKLREVDPFVDYSGRRQAEDEPEPQVN